MPHIYERELFCDACARLILDCGLECSHAPGATGPCYACGAPVEAPPIRRLASPITARMPPTRKPEGQRRGLTFGMIPATLYSSLVT